MCYVDMVQSASTYSFRIENKDTQQTARLGYAWSTGDRNKELHHIDMEGITAVGKTLSVTGYCNDGTIVPVESVYYQWKRSSDCITWQSITGATDPDYTLTLDDRLKYIRCEVTPSGDSIVTSTTKFSITDKRVIRYGDADLSGTVTSLDATYIQMYLASLVTFNDENLLAADVDGSGTVTSLDATLIQRRLAGLIDHFPVEE